MKYAVLSFASPDAKMTRLIEKAGCILGRRMSVATTPDSEMNMTFYQAATGGKELYSEQIKSDEDRFPIYINPTFGNLRPLAMKTVRGFMKLSPRHKSLTYSTLACLYGLEGREGKNSPHLRAKFVLTYMDATHPRHADHQYCASLANKLGFKVIDLADSKGREAFGLLLRKLSA